MEEHKYKKWMFTWNAENDESLIQHEKLTEILESIAITFVYQKEKVTREHYQGFFILAQRDRLKTILNKIKVKLPSDKLDYIKNLTLQNMHGTIEEAIAYCSKSESKVSETIYSSDIRPFIPQDLAIFDDKSKLYAWQCDIHKMLFNSIDFLKQRIITKPDDRSINVIVDEHGNSGKSKFVKYLCYNYEKDICKLAFGTAQQLRSAVISAGRKKVYILDIPRTLGLSDNIYDIISVVEDIKNGFVCSSMYGKYEKLLMEPPHIIIFTNKEIDSKLMSMDRWKSYKLQKDKTLSSYQQKIKHNIRPEIQPAPELADLSYDAIMALQENYEQN